MAGQDFQVSITGTVTGFDVAPITNMNNALKQVPPAAQQASTAGQGLNTSLAQVTNTSRATGTQFQATGSLANAFGNNINTARGSAQQMVGTNGALGTSFGGVASGGLNANNTLNQLGTGLNNTTTATGGTERSSISLGQKIALMGGFITSSVGSVFGLIEGFTGLEAAQVAADRAQQRVNTSSLAAEKAQDLYNKQVDKFGPASRQAQEALANLQNKNEANRIAEERSQVTQSKLNEAYVSFGLEVVTVAGEMAQMGSTVSILVGKLGTHAAAAAISADASAAEGIAAGEAGLGLDVEALAADNAAKSTEATGFAALGMGAKFALIATPLIAAAALFLLIETNTFGLGDAFRTITPQIGSAIDTIVNAVAMIYNAFIKVTEVIVEWGGNTINTFLDAYNAVNTFLDQVVVGFTNLGIDIQNALTKISVFFANNLIIPITNAWGVFNQGFKDAWQATINTLVDIFKPAVSTLLDIIKKIVDAGAQIPLGLGDWFKKAQQPINDAIESLKKVGTQAGTTGKQAADAFTPIPPIILKGTDEIKRMTTSGLFPLSNAYVDVTGTIKQLDSGLITNAGNIKTGAEGFLNYYSHINNVSGALKANLSPALQASSKFIQDNVKELTGWFTPASAMEGETKKIGGELGKTGKEVKTFSGTLTENTNKQNENAAATLKSITTGQQHAKTLSDLNKSFADATVKIADLSTKLTDATAVQQRHSIAVAEGTAKYLDFIVKTQDAITTQQQYQTILEKTGAGFVALNLGLDATVKNMELITKAALGDADAFKELQGEVTKLYEEFNKLGDTVSSKLGDALEKGHKQFSKALKELSKETGVNFKELGDKMAFEVDAGLQNAKKTLDTDLGAMAVLIRQHAPNIAQATEQMIGKLQDEIKGAQPGTIAAWNKIFDDMRRIAAEPIPTAASIGQLEKDMKALNIPADQAQSILNQLRGNLTGVGGAAVGASGGITQYSNGVAAAVDLNAGFTRGVSDAIGQLNILQTNAATAFINMLVALKAVATGFDLAFNQGVAAANAAMILLETDAATAFTNIINALSAVGQAFPTAFNAGVNAAATALNNLVSLADTDFATIITGLNAVATAMVTDFNGATKVAGTDMNSLTTNVNGNVAAWIKGFNAAATALANDFNAGTKTAGTAMNSLTTNVNTNVNNMITALNRVITEFNNIKTSISNAASAVDSLISRIKSIPTSVNVNVNIIEHITQVVTVKRQPITPASIGTASGITTTSGGTTTTTTLSEAAAIPQGGKARVIRLEISEPTIVKIDGRELIKQINKKLLELDIGALV